VRAPIDWLSAIGAPSAPANTVSHSEYWQTVVRLIPLVCLCEFRMPKVPLYTR
jgi:hypothetical protein